MQRYSLKSALLEAALGPGDLSPEIGVIVKWSDSQRKIAEIHLAEITDQGFQKFAHNDPRYGMLKIKKRPSGIEAYKVAWSWVSSDGMGPMLYDIGAELATIHGVGLHSDEEVSDSAIKVWEYYLDHRTDVQIHQDDDRHNTLTPDPGDNRIQNPAKAWAYKNKKHWSESPLSKRITKEPTTIEQLKKMGKWYETID